MVFISIGVDAFPSISQQNAFYQGCVIAENCRFYCIKFSEDNQNLPILYPNIIFRYNGSVRRIA